MSALDFRALLTTQDFEQGIRRIQEQIQGITRTTQRETQQMDGMFKNLGLSIGAYFSASALNGFVQEIINVRGEFQKTEIAFGTMLQSTEKAKALMGQMVDLAAKTPFGLQEVSEGAKRLLAFQIPAEQVIDTLTRLGNVSAGLGVPMGQLIHVYGQVKAQGKLMTNDLYQFMNAGIPILSELGKVLGKTEAEIKNMVGEGKIGFTEIQQVIQNMTNEGGLFFNLMEKQSASLSGQIANLGDAWEQMLNQIGEQNEGILYKGIEGLTTLVENYDEVIRVLGVLVATYGAYRTALILTSVAQQGATTPAVIQGLLNLTKLIRGLTVEQAAFNAVSLANPYVLLATALVGLIAVCVAYSDELSEMIGLTEKANAQMRLQEQIDQKLTNTFSKGVSEKRSKIQELIFVLDNENTTLEQRKRAYEELIRIDPTFIGTLDGQYRYTVRLGEAFDLVVQKMQNFAVEQAKMAAIQDVLQKNAEDELQFSMNKTKVKQIAPDFMTKAKNAGFDLEKNPENFYHALSHLSYNNQLTRKQVEQLRDLSQAYTKTGEAVKTSREELQAAQKVQKETLYQQQKEYKAIQDAEKRGWKTFDGKAYTEKYIQQLKHRKKELEELNSMLNPQAETQQTTEPPKTEKPKKEKKPKKIKDEAIKGSLGALEDELARVQKQLKDKTLINDKERVKELLNNEKELQEQIKKIQEERRQKTFDEELQEIQRQTDVRDKLLQAGYSKESVDEMFPKIKDTTFLGYLEETKKALQDLINSGKGDQETAQNLDRINTAIDDFTKRKTYIDEVNKTIENLGKKFSGQELIDKLEALKKLNANETEKEQQQKTALLNQAIEKEKELMKQALKDFIENHKSYEEQRLDITKKYAQLRSQAEQEGLSTTTIDKAEKNDLATLDLDFMKKGGDWELAFTNLDYLSRDTIKRIIGKLEEFKNAQAENLDPTELRELTQTIEKLREKANINPFAGIVSGIKGFISAKESVKKAQKDYDDAVSMGGEKSDKAKEKYKKLTEEERKQATEKEKLANAFGNANAIFQASISGIQDLGNAFGGFDDATNDALEDIANIGGAALELGTSISSGNIAGMISGGIKLIGSLFSAFSGDKKKERNIKKWKEAVDGLKNAYQDLERAMKKALGESVYQENAKMIANLRQQQAYLNKMINAERSKKKTDNSKIQDWENQKKEIDRQISDIFDDLNAKIAQTDAKTLADQIGDALVDAFSRGESAALAYEKTMDEVMKNAIKSALKQKLLEEPMKAIVDNMITKMGFGAENEKTIAENELQKAKEKLEAFQKTNKKGLWGQIQLKHLQEAVKKAEQKVAEATINLNGSFDGLTDAERKELKEQGKNAMEQYMNALKEYEDLFGSAATNSESLKGAIKGMSEETADVLAGQFNAIRINTGELVKNSAFNLEAMRNAVGELIKIEQNTYNLHQMKKDLSELNAKISGGDTLRAKGF